MSFEEFLAKAESIVDDRQEYLDAQEEDNRDARREACGQLYSFTFQYDGGQKWIINKCGDYRKCDNCREQKWLSELEPRLRYAQNHLPLGQFLKWRLVHDNDKEAFQKAIKRSEGKFYAFPQPNHMNLIIHNSSKVNGEDLYDFDEYRGEDINFEQVLKDVPRDRRISGYLGKPAVAIEEEDGEGDGDAPEKDEDEWWDTVRIPFIYSATATKREINLAYTEAVKETQNIDVGDMHVLSDAMFARARAMCKHLPEDTIIYHEPFAVSSTQAQEWNKNDNNGVVQIAGIENNHTVYSDKDMPHGFFTYLKIVGEIPKDAVFTTT